MSRPKAIYLAGPYSNLHDKTDDTLPKKRFDTLTDVAGILLKMGFFVYSPITHSRPIAQVHNLPQTFGFWAKMDEWHIDCCDAVWVVALDGWQESVGVKHEIRYALKTGKEVALVIGKGVRDDLSVFLMYFQLDDFGNPELSDKIYYVSDREDVDE